MLESNKYKLSRELQGELLSRSSSCSTSNGSLYQYTESLILLNDQRNYCKNFVLRRPDDHSICADIKDSYHRQGRIKESYYVVKMVEDARVKNKPNYYCIFNHFCSYGHVVQLRNYPEESDTTLDFFNDAYKEPPTLTESLVIEIVRATVTAIKMVELQATTEPNYRSLLMKLDLKKVLISGQLPNDPVVRLSGFYNQDEVKQHGESPENYWVISSESSKKNLVWLLGKMTLYLLTDIKLENLPYYPTEELTINFDAITPIFGDSFSDEVQSFLRRSLIQKDLSWHEFLFGLDSFPGKNCWIPAQKLYAFTGEFFYGDLKYKPDSTDQKGIKLETELKTPIHKEENCIAFETFTPSSQPQHQSGDRIFNRNPFLDDFTEQPVQQTVQQTVQIRNILTGELNRLRFCCKIALGQLDPLKQLVLASKDGQELVNLYYLVQMVLQKCCMAVRRFQSQLDEGILPGPFASLVFATPDIVKAAAAEEPSIKHKVDEFTTKFLQWNDKLIAGLRHNLAFIHSNQEHLLPNSFIGILLLTTDRITDKEKLDHLLKNSWIENFNYFETKKCTLPVECYEKLLTFGYYLVYGPLFSHLSEGIVDMKTSIINENYEPAIADISRIRTQLEKSPAQAYQEILTKLSTEVNRRF
jgi:hypothetical protein